MLVILDAGCMGYKLHTVTRVPGQASLAQIFRSDKGFCDKLLLLLEGRRGGQDWGGSPGDNSSQQQTLNLLSLQQSLGRR